MSTEIVSTRTKTQTINQINKKFICLFWKLIRNILFLSAIRKIFAFVTETLVAIVLAIEVCWSDWLLSYFKFISKAETTL